MMMSLKIRFTCKRDCLEKFKFFNYVRFIYHDLHDFDWTRTHLSAGPSDLTCVTVNGLHISGSGCAPPRNTIPRLPSSRSMNTSITLCFTYWSENKNNWDTIIHLSIHCIHVPKSYSCELYIIFQYTIVKYKEK
jgi:hypothetical protein